MDETVKIIRNVIMLSIFGVVIGLLAYTVTTAPKTSPENLPVYSISEIQKHNTPDDCWTVIEGKVYNITPYANLHPGGSVILESCGIDGTTLFQTKDNTGKIHSEVAKLIMEKYKIGILR